MRIAGVDTDSKGSIAVIDDESMTVTIYYVPSFKRQLKNGKQRATLNRKVTAQYIKEVYDKPLHAAYLEEQWSRPEQDAGSTFSFGCIYCSLVQTFDAMAFISDQNSKLIEVHSSIWKHALKLTADKQEARDLATKIFPLCAPAWKLKEYTSAAEATLIAFYGYVKESASVDPRKFKEYTLVLPAKRRVTLTNG